MDRRPTLRMAEIQGADRLEHPWNQALGSAEACQAQSKRSREISDRGAPEHLLAARAKPD
jgi:hypothetical protein